MRSLVHNKAVRGRLAEIERFLGISPLEQSREPRFAAVITSPPERVFQSVSLHQGRLPLDFASYNVTIQ